MTLQRIAVITGPTASGKTDFSLALARILGAEIVVADSMQVYRGLDIGTAKPTMEQRREVPHHLLDIAGIDEPFNAARFRETALAAIGEISGRGRPCLVVGGTALYIKVLLEGLVDAPGRDEILRAELQRRWESGEREALYRELCEADLQSAQKIHPNDRTRTIRGLELWLSAGVKPSQLRAAHSFAERPFDALVFAMSVERGELYRRIDARVEEMVVAGWVGEVRALLEGGYPPDLTPFGAIGYREIVKHITHGVPMDETVAMIKKSTRNFAKRQLTWMRKMEVSWVSVEDVLPVAGQLGDFFSKRGI